MSPAVKDPPRFKRVIAPAQNPPPAQQTVQPPPIDREIQPAAPGPIPTPLNKKGQPKGKAGRPRKITVTVEQRICDILAAGSSITDAADIVGLSREGIIQRKRSDPEFNARVNEAVANGKHRLIQKVGNAKQWQAAAWILERKWGREWGRRDRYEHRGIPPAGNTTVAVVNNPPQQPSDVTVTHRFEDDSFAESFRAAFADRTAHRLPTVVQRELLADPQNDGHR